MNATWAEMNLVSKLLSKFPDAKFYPINIPQTMAMDERVPMFEMVFDTLKHCVNDLILVHQGASMSYRFSANSHCERAVWIGLPFVDIILYISLETGRMAATGTDADDFLASIKQQ